ncbi:MAG: hypothetical protein F4077_01690 [Gammaproteobacteria bacterium]|nr:hypothetical protein [Gammaproteobacteria bacterium]
MGAIKDLLPNKAGNCWVTAQGNQKFVEAVLVDPAHRFAMAESVALVWPFALGVCVLQPLESQGSLEPDIRSGITV